ncbi:MAG: hypothetical protein JW783_13725 [Bacteroidales bacterium]|nr:hypothetical protein [Bacteroidales bacterium]MBN2749433.1 hypothetical protein [Bacteroidales bacterium]
MIESFIKYYSENLTFNAIVIKKNGIAKNLIFWFLMLFASSILMFFISTKMYYWSLVVIPILVFAVILGLYFNAMTIKKYYPKIYISKLKWSSEKLNEMIFSRLDAYISEKKIENKIDEIQRIINEKAKNEKLPFIMRSSTFIALFLPLWNSYIDKLLEYYKIDIKAMTIISLFIIILILVITIYIPMIYVLRDNFLTRYKKLNSLSELLDEYKIWKK